MSDARKRFPISRPAAFLLWGVLVLGVLRAPPQNILSWDTFGYHLYLPATFIHHDLGLNDAAWVQEAMTKYEAGGKPYQINPTADGRWVMKYPMGLAILWLPFFLIAHVLAGILGFAQDGFSAPYQWALIIAALVYMLIGILVLRRVLQHFFSEVITTATLALIVTGTNYFHQAVYSTGMPHVFLFTLGAGVLWYSIRWHKDRRRTDAMITGALLGLLVVSRPSEIVWVLVPLLIGLTDTASWKDQLSTLWSRRKHLIIMVAMATVVCVPQLVYWKWMTGKWLYMSYNNPGEGFEFLHPYTWDVLFSFRKGWYIYTPIMLVHVGHPAPSEVLTGDAVGGDRLLHLEPVHREQLVLLVVCRQFRPARTGAELSADGPAAWRRARVVERTRHALADHRRCRAIGAHRP
ncbi:MAG: glycosyltransferase family 39 protein [Flavobacteriales bacterium]|nr:glycosyltransferase family 39 protein [Flavobacteriales bacterium]